MSRQVRKKRGGWLPIVVLVAILVGIPLIVMQIQSSKSGMTWGQIIDRGKAKLAGETTGLEDVFDVSLPARERIEFLVPQTIGLDIQPDQPRPLVSQTTTVDLDGDGLLDVIVCDIALQRVSWIRQHPRGVFTETLLGDLLDAPARAEPVDIDGDGDLDLAVADLGMLNPNNDPIGSVVLLVNDGNWNFTNRTVLENVARVADIRAGDLDGDGDPDLALAQFGYDDGETRWLRNDGNYSFTSRRLHGLAGPIHCPISDLDGDGDLDIAVLVSQEFEMIYVFRNDGRGEFEVLQVFGSTNEDFGSSSLSVADVDQDGDPDLLYTNGDAFDYLPPRPRPWHGVQYLENEGDMKFTLRRLGDLGGATMARAVDVDRDGDLDVVAVSTFNLWKKPRSQSMVWFENDGSMRFARRDITNDPTHLLTLDLGDFDGDGRIDLVTGGMNFFAPYDRASRVKLWRNVWGD